MTARIAYYGAGTADTQTALAGFDGGYFLTDGGAADRFALFHIDAPDTSLSSYTIESSQRFVAHNTAGQVYAIGSATTTTDYLAAVSLTGTTITVGTAGTFTHTPARTRHLSLSYDGTEAVVFNQTDTKFLVLSTADASVIGDTTLTVGHTSSWIVAAAGSGRAVGTNLTTGFDLWDGPTDTLLDELAYTYTVNGTNPKPVIPLGDDRLFFAMGIDEGADPINLWVGVISTAGDSLSYEWQAVLGTQWDSSNTSVMLADVKGRTAFIAPKAEFFDSPSYLYTVDTVTGTVTPSGPLSNVAPGAKVYGPFFCGADHVVWTENQSPFLNRIWALTYSTATYLRLHQSEVYAPSRVRGVDLRQRQTNRITG